MSLYDHFLKILDKVTSDPDPDTKWENARFPEVDWYCERCDAYLNRQPGFDDHKYIWKCTECGFKNSISSDNIIDF